jgi:hypothetical protein
MLTWNPLIGNCWFAGKGVDPLVVFPLLSVTVKVAPVIFPVASLLRSISKTYPAGIAFESRGRMCWNELKDWVVELAQYSTWEAIALSLIRKTYCIQLIVGLETPGPAFSCMVNPPFGIGVPPLADVTVATMSCVTCKDTFRPRIF